MTVKKKRILIEIIILAAFIALIAIGGKYERGYWAIASEPFVAVFGALVIWIRRGK